MPLLCAVVEWEKPDGPWARGEIAEEGEPERRDGRKLVGGRVRKEQRGGDRLPAFFTDAIPRPLINAMHVTSQYPLRSPLDEAPRTWLSCRIMDRLQGSHESYF